jgi:hypothetical protein
MRSRRTVAVIVLLIAGLLLAGPEAADRLHRRREDPRMKGLRITDLDSLGAAGVLLLGGFRGIAVDVLWLRIMYLHQQREYAAERSLIELLLKMQPDHKAVWVFQSWNIAYNISVQFSDPAEQWPWIKDAIAFLREGIRINPDSGDLLFAMGWIYRHKIPQNRYFEEALEKEEGINNYEEAARWFDRARRAAEPVTALAERVVDSSVFQCYLSRAEQILARSDLDDLLAFPADAMTHADQFLKKAWYEVEGDDEHPGVIERHRDAEGGGDTALLAFPARLDLFLAQACIDQIPKTLWTMRFSDAAYDRARKILDKSLAEMAKYRPKYWDTTNRWVMVHKYEDAWLAVPAQSLDRFVLLMDQGDAREAERMLDKAQAALAGAEAGLGAAGVESADLERLRREYDLRRDQFTRVHVRQSR